MISSKRVLIANLYCKYKASKLIPTRKLHQGLTKAVVRRCSIKISQISRESTCVGVFF